MEDAPKFSHLTPKKHVHVIYGDNNKEKYLELVKLVKLPLPPEKMFCLLMVLSIIYLALVNYVISIIESFSIQTIVS